MVSYFVNICHLLVKLISYNKDSYWGVLEDSRDFFLRKWTGVSLLDLRQEDPVVLQGIDRVLTLWNTLSASKGSAVFSTAYARYMTLGTNELEGVF